MQSSSYEEKARRMYNNPSSSGGSLGQKLQAIGAVPIIGDSPGGLFTPRLLKVYMLQLAWRMWHSVQELS